MNELPDLTHERGNRNWYKHSLRLLKHELRRGELTIVLLAIMLAVSAVFALTGFSSRVEQALTAQSSAFIAADRVLDTGSELPSEILTEAARFELRQALQIQMASMVFAQDKMVLASLAAISPTYPLRGELLVSYAENDSASQAVNAPNRGEAWLQPSGLTLLQVGIGDSIEVGLANFKVSGVIRQIPDASFSAFNAGPVVLINTADVHATGLIQPASRLSYKYLFAGDSGQIQAFEDWLLPQLTDNQRWYDIRSQQSPLARALNRADKYLSLASMLGIVLAAVAVAVASRRYCQRHQPVVAVFKTMGASRRYITKLYCLHWSLLSAFSIALGLIIGYMLLSLGWYVMSDNFNVVVHSSDGLAYPLLVAVATGIICALAFAITPLRQLVSTSPMTLLRGAPEALQANRLLALMQRTLSQLPALLAIFSLLCMFSKDAMLSSALMLGSLFVAITIVITGQLLMSLGRSAGTKAGTAWHLALANLKRRSLENSVQLISFTIAIQLLLIIAVMKTSLIDDWQQQLPVHSANRFLVNISSSQINEVEDLVASLDIKSSGLFAVVRGRLTAINDTKVAREVSKDKVIKADNGRRGVGRELNLTWRDELPLDNQIVSGSWWQENDQRALVSIESRLAARLKISLGDSLHFQLGSDEVVAEVSSIREVNWQSLQPNFYMVFNRHVLGDFPATYIASLYVPEQSKQALQDFLSQYPTITMLDIDSIISQLRRVIDQVSIAVEFILVLVMLAGCLVLVAQVQASIEERERELAILRTLGASGRLLKRSVCFEFFALGGLAGLMASIAMEMGIYILQTQVFAMSASLHLDYWLLAIGAGAGFVGLVGYLSCWRLLHLPTMTLIRRTM